MVSHANPILYMVSGFRFGFLGVSDVDRAVWQYRDHGRRSRSHMFSLAVTLMNRGTGIRE